MGKTATALLLSAMAATQAYAATSNIYADQCNPSTHCPGSSTQCFKCNPRLNPGCGAAELANPSSADLEGFCLEPLALSKKKSFGQDYEDRCRRLVDPTGGNSIPAEDYVRACREFEYTCNDGTCEDVKGLPKKCKKAIAGSKKCDTDNTDLQDTILNLWQGYSDDDLSNVCSGHGGVRYDYLQCATNWNGNLASAEDECNEDNPNKIDAPECNFEELPPVTETTLTCEEVELSIEQEACCIDPEANIPSSGKCVPLLQFGPSYPENPVPPTGGTGDKPASGIVTTLDMSTSPVDCCCDFSCQCFGDPHCTSYFGDYEISMDNLADFTMYEQGTFKLHVNQGPPSGVIKSAEITMSAGGTTTVDADLCTAANTESYINPLPAGWTFSAGDLPSVTPKYEIYDEATQTTTTIICVFFEQKIGNNVGEFSRLDVTIVKDANGMKEIVGDDQCCPSNQKAHDNLDAQGASGFCMKLPGEAAMLSSRRNRRLAAGTPEIKVEELPRHLEVSNMNICQELNGMGSALANPCYAYASCMLIENETGGGSCSQILNNNDQCHAYATDPIFAPGNYDECAQGIKFQAKKKDSNSWTTLFFFPEDVDYCNDQVIINFSQVKLNGETLSLSEHDMQYVLCAPPETCNTNFCKPELNVNDLKAQITYPCVESEVQANMLEHAMDSCDACATVAEYSQCLADCHDTGVCGC